MAAHVSQTVKRDNSLTTLTQLHPRANILKNVQRPSRTLLENGIIVWYNYILVFRKTSKLHSFDVKSTDIKRVVISCFVSELAWKHSAVFSVRTKQRIRAYINDQL